MKTYSMIKKVLMRDGRTWTWTEYIVEAESLKDLKEKLTRELPGYADAMKTLFSGTSKLVYLNPDFIQEIVYDDIVEVETRTETKTVVVKKNVIPTSKEILNENCC